jgi:hypothetical protein
VNDIEEPLAAPRRKPVDITVPVLVAAGVLVLGVGLAYLLGAIPRPLAAASAAALALVVVLFAVSIVELIDSRLVIGWTSDELPGWLRRPGVPVAALGIGVVIGYFFW